MTIPVTSRLDESVVEALDLVVQAGLAENRSDVFAKAVSDWLERNGEEVIVGSYRRRCASRDVIDEDSLARLGAFSVSTCLAQDRYLGANKPAESSTTRRA